MEAPPTKLFRTRFCSPECYISELIRYTPMLLSKSPDEIQLFTQLKEVFRPSNNCVEELTWDQGNSSNIITCSKGLALVTGPVASSFCTAITEQGFKNGRHYW